MAPLSNDRYLDAVTAESGLLADALAGADLARRVPACPHWTLDDLGKHVGESIAGRPPS